MKNIIYKVFVLLCMVLLTNCNDEEFLREDPPAEYTTENIYSTSQQVEQTLIKNYHFIRGRMTTSAAFKFNGTDMFDVPTIRLGDSFNDYSKISPLTGTFNGIYADSYRIINRANLALSAADYPQIEWASEEEKEYIVAQARFFRAYAYLTLGELYGGVPIVTEITDVPKYDYVRATRVETYQYAIDELLAIEDDLPIIPTSRGRISRGAAQHYLCELYLAKGIELAANGEQSTANEAFGKSIEYGDKLIEGPYSLIQTRFGTRKTETEVYYGNGFTLETSNVIDTCETNYYWDLFQEGNQDIPENTESIWTAQVDYEAYKIIDDNSKLPYARNYGPVFRANSGGHWDSNSTNEDVGGRGITAICPTFYTRDDIYSGKWADDMRNSQIVFRRNIKGNRPDSPYYKKYVPWSEIYLNDKDKTLCYPISCKISTDKFTGIDEGENKSNLFRNDYIIRLAETVLLRAEAKQRLGNKQGAADDINLLRERAQCSYLVTAADVDDNFDLILDERARELVYEECRWNTLLRMGGNIAVERIRKYAYWPVAKSTLTFDYNLWPIPQEVINLNIAEPMQQNPGWENR
ncbi:RagB/SusD family nutrient uptake outer membrane protein [Maribellus maritimus]|uniref:RagB/SusD family nutrient uptake outer membrane protein n=1 Tax=Maribellus maritimus TaxID=2870838 RepID=UPI001EEC2841|nr:RagB/SusD family nutrient uptake outer membrane protein [Maribellus maritimus]MCG6191337.1 RagB/SusD family nutrient uptake outer membrane protein [Maribellus maritimus]